MVIIYSCVLLATVGGLQWCGDIKNEDNEQMFYYDSICRCVSSACKEIGVNNPFIKENMNQSAYEVLIWDTSSLSFFLW